MLKQVLKIAGNNKSSSKSGSMPGGGEGTLRLLEGGANLPYLGSAIWVRPNYLVSENSRSQMYYLCHDIFVFSQLWLTSHPRSTEMCFLWSEIWDR